jgi:hypothetical protein
MKSPQSWRNFFHGERGAYTPLSAHADSEQGAQHQKTRVAMSEASCHLDQGVEDEVDHQGNAAAIAIGHQSEDERADGTERKGKGDGESDLFVSPVKLLRDGSQGKDDQEKVKRIKCPSEKAGEKGGTVPIFRRQDRRRSRVVLRQGRFSFTPANTIQRIRQRRRPRSAKRRELAPSLRGGDCS